jgi:hypothetical protein
MKGMRWIAAVLLMLASARAGATPTEWQARCVEELQRELGRLAESDAFFRAGEIRYSTPDLEPAFVAYRLVSARQEQLSAVVQRDHGVPPRAWERDDKWNYPIDPALAWREARSLPDVQGQFSIAHRAQAGGASELQLAAFRIAAKHGIDKCMAAVSTWRAPGGTLRWEHVDADGVLERLEIKADGAASWGRQTRGGASGEMGMVSAAELGRVAKTLVENDACALRSALESGAGASLSIATDGLTCKVRLCDSEWRGSARARASMDAVMSLRETLRASRTSAPRE